MCGNDPVNNSDPTGLGLGLMLQGADELKKAGVEGADISPFLWAGYQQYTTGDLFDKLGVGQAAEISWVEGYEIVRGNGKTVYGRPFYLPTYKTTVVTEPTPIADISSCHGGSVRTVTREVVVQTGTVLGGYTYYDSLDNLKASFTDPAALKEWARVYQRVEAIMALASLKPGTSMLPSAFVAEGAASAKAGIAGARTARDVLSAELAPLKGRAPATVTGGYNVRTGDVAARASGGGKCAEDRVVEALGGAKEDVRFTEAVRPRNSAEVPVCPKCEKNYGRDSFPSSTRFKSDK